MKEVKSDSVPILIRPNQLSSRWTKTFNPVSKIVNGINYNENVGKEGQKYSIKM